MKGVGDEGEERLVLWDMGLDKVAEQEGMCFWEVGMGMRG